MKNDRSDKENRYELQRSIVGADAKQIGILHLFPNETVETNYGDNAYILRDMKKVISIVY